MIPWAIMQVADARREPLIVLFAAYSSMVIIATTSVSLWLPWLVSYSLRPSGQRWLPSASAWIALSMG